MERHNANALALAQWLEREPKAGQVIYPGLPSHPQHAIAKRQMNGFGGMISVRLRTDLAGTKRFLEHQAETIRRFRAGELDKGAAQLDIEHFWAGALRRAVIDGDVENGSLMAGQSVGMVTREQPAAEIIAELTDQALAALLARGRSAA
jgi:hypothetical protein